MAFHGRLCIPVILKYPKVSKHIFWLLKVTWRIRLNYQNTTAVIFEHIAMHGNEHPAIALVLHDDQIMEFKGEHT